MRNININLDGYANLIHSDNLIKVANSCHPMADMPYYDKTNYPVKLHEEIIIESRYKELCNIYSKVCNVDTMNILPQDVAEHCFRSYYQVAKLESTKRKELTLLVEEICRKEFNLSKDEVLFDIEIISQGECKMPSEINFTKRTPSNFKQSNNFDILKKRTINCLSQGAALKSHYIFYLYKNDFEKFCPNICESYEKLLVTNDLSCFMLSDDMGMGSPSASNAHAGYSRINFDNDIPIIEAKSVNAPILIHEVTKAIITLLSINGIQNIPKNIPDETDYVEAEFWDIRFGTVIWEKFHSLLDYDDYDIKKLIIMELFKMDSSTFVNEFMYNVLNNPDKAKIIVKQISRKIREKIRNYRLNN